MSTDAERIAEIQAAFEKLSLDGQKIREAQRDLRDAANRAVEGFDVNQVADERTRDNLHETLREFAYENQLEMNRSHRDGTFQFWETSHC